MNRLVLIDGNAILHRAFYALPETLTLKNGTPVNAVYGFTSMLLKVIQDLQPSFVVCSFDLPKPTFRDELYADYRAQRPPTPDKLVSQVEMVKSMVKAFGIPICEVEGYEADDVIGTLAKQASQISNLKSQISNKSSEGVRMTLRSPSDKIPNSCLALPRPASPCLAGRRAAGGRQAGGRRAKPKTKSNVAIEQFNNEAIEEVIIVTGDRDLLQLVNSHTKCYMPVKGLTQAKLYGPKEVEEKYGIKPEQMVDYKALVGDPSDNYPGVKGIGPKTAQSLLEKFGSLDAIYKHIQKKDQRSQVVFLQKGSVEVLERYKKDALMAKKLAKIVTDVPVELDLQKAKLGRIDRPDVKQQFNKLAFKTLWRRVKEMDSKKQENIKTREQRSARTRIDRSDNKKSDQLSIL